MDITQINTSPRTYHSVRGMILIKAMMVIRSPLTSVLRLSLQTLLKSIGNGHFHKNWDQQINLEKPLKRHQPVVIAFKLSAPQIEREGLDGKRLKVSLHHISITRLYPVFHDSLYSNLRFIAILKYLLIHFKKSVKYLSKEWHHTDAWDFRLDNFT